MPRFSLTQLFMTVALAGVLLTFVRSEGCGRRGQLVSELKFSPDGTRLAVARHDARDAQTPMKFHWRDVSRTISLMSVPTLDVERVVQRDLRPGVRGPAMHLFSRAENQMAFVDDRTLAALEFGGGALRLVDLASGDVNRTLATRSAGWTTAMSRDRKVLAVLTEYDFTTWNVAASDPLFLQTRAMTNPSARPWRSRGALSRDGSLAAYESYDGVEIVGASGLAAPIALADFADDDDLRSLEFSPTRDLLAVASREWVRLYDSQGNQTMHLAAGEEISDVSFSPDGEVLAAIVDGGVDLLDVETGKRLRSLATGEDDRRVAFSPDGRYLATASRGSLVQLWDARSGELLTSRVAPGRVRPPWTLPVALLAVWAFVCHRLARRSRRRAAVRAQPAVTIVIPSPEE